jgi:hypothetical protein
MIRQRLWLRGAREVVQVCAQGEPFLRGPAARAIVRRQAPDGDGLSLVVDWCVAALLVWNSSAQEDVM